MTYAEWKKKSLEQKIKYIGNTKSFSFEFYGSYSHSGFSIQELQTFIDEQFERYNIPKSSKYTLYIRENDGSPCIEIIGQYKLKDYPGLLEKLLQEREDEFKLQDEQNKKLMIEKAKTVKKHEHSSLKRLMKKYPDKVTELINNGEI